jgi:hypothetical protein
MRKNCILRIKSFIHPPKIVKSNFIYQKAHSCTDWIKNNKQFCLISK